MSDVFISYKAESALPLVENAVCPALEAADIKCWYAKRDAKSGVFAGQINRAIQECRVFLLILEQAAFRSEHLKNEVALAFRRYSENPEQITIIPFRVDDCNVRSDLDLDYYLIRQQIIDGCPPDERHIQDLVDNIVRILSEPQ